jgi:phosphopantothenoylcysteine synthetase/decarboxylase
MKDSADKPAAAAPSVVLGVTGSIAAYKAAELTSRLVQAGVAVDVILTANAMRLVQPQTFFTLSRRPVVTDLWELPDWQPGHIALAERAAVLVVAPATANTLAKLAHGIADDALSTYALSHSGRLIVAPAMNPRMWGHPAVQANCTMLRARGVQFVGPDSGHVACGEDGAGRMAAVDAIATAVLDELGRQGLR